MQDSIKYQRSVRLVIAILDSGIAYDHPALACHDFWHFDFTGEGPYDYNGHGTGVASLALKGMLPGSVIVLNIKIMNKFLELDEITMLQGIEKACEEGAHIVNLSAGIRKQNKEDCYTCKRFRQLTRRNYKTLFVMAAGNKDDSDPPLTDYFIIPQMCGHIEIPKDSLNQECFEDAVYLAARGEYDEAQKLIVGIRENEPEKELDNELIALNRTILFVQLGLQAHQNGQEQEAVQCFENAQEFNRSYIDISHILERK